MVGGIAILLSITAFIIPKFIAIWTIPQLAEASATGGVGSVFADQLLLILNVTVPFSLYTSFDYLGFWLYALFALVIAAPLFKHALIWKFAAVSLGFWRCLSHTVDRIIDEKSGASRHSILVSWEHFVFPCRDHCRSGRFSNNGKSILIG